MSDQTQDYSGAGNPAAEAPPPPPPPPPQQWQGSAPVPTPAPVAMPAAPSGMPMPEVASYPVPAAPKARRSVLAWVFAAIAVLLLVAAGVGGVLFYETKKQTDQRMADQRAQIAELQKKVNVQTNAISDREAAIRAAQRDLATAQQKVTEGTPCSRSVQALWDLAEREDTATIGAAIRAMADACGAHL